MAGRLRWLTRVELVSELASHVAKPRRAPPPIPRRPDQSTGKKNKQLVGIGGWLALLAIGQILAPVKVVISYFQTFEDQLRVQFPIAFYGELSLYICFLGLLIYVGVLLFH